MSLGATSQHLLQQRNEKTAQKEEKEALLSVREEKWGKEKAGIIILGSH